MWNKNFLKRVISSLIMVTIVIGLILITSFSGISGRIVGLVVTLMLGTYVYVETMILTVKRRAFFLVFGIISIFLIFGLDYNFIINIIEDPNKGIAKEFKKIFSWWTFIIPFLSIIPIMFIKNHDDKVTTNNIFFTIMFLNSINYFYENNIYSCQS